MAGDRPFCQTLLGNSHTDGRRMRATPEAGGYPTERAQHGPVQKIFAMAGGGQAELGLESQEPRAESRGTGAQSCPALDPRLLTLDCPVPRDLFTTDIAGEVTLLGAGHTRLICPPGTG